MKKIQLLAVAGVILLGSCTMEKRHFLPGFYTDFKKSESKTQSSKSETCSIAKQNIVGTNPSVQRVSIIENSKKKLLLGGTEKSDHAGSNSGTGIRKYKTANISAIRTHKKIAQVRSVKNTLQKYSSKSQSPTNEDFPGWAYILIALFIPPLAVALKYGVHLAFWLCFIFTLLGFVPGLIYALVYLALQGNNPEK